MIPHLIKKRSNREQEEIPLVLWNDAQLLKAFVISENSEALRVIIERYGPMVMTVCKRATAQHVDAEDAFQATFLILVQRARKIRKQKSLAGWLFQVARRTAVRARQRQQNKRELNVLADHEPISNQNLFAEIAQEFEAEQIEIFLAGLPEKYRDPLVMFHYQQMSVSEICEALNSTQGSIEGLLKRGRSELKKRLQQAGITLSSFAIVALLSQFQSEAGQICSAGLINQTVSTLTGSADLTTTLPESIEHLAQQEWMPMLTKTAIAKSTLITSAALSIAIIAGSTFVLGEPPQGESSINTQLTLGENEPSSDNPDDDFVVRDKQPANEKENVSTNGKTAQKPTANRPDAWKEMYRQALKEDTEFAFVDTPLSDAVEIIGEMYNINIRLDTLALEEAGIPIDEPVNLMISGISLESALEIMFENIANEELDYVLEHEVMKITTRARADELMEVLFYPIPEQVLSASKNGEISGAEAFTSNGGDSAMEKVSPIGSNSTPVVSIEALSELIMAMTQGPWKVIDKQGGSIRIVGDTLVIRQTQRSHREIEKLLDNMKSHFENKRDSGSSNPTATNADSKTHSKVFIPKAASKGEKQPRSGQGGGGFF